MPIIKFKRRNSFKWTSWVFLKYNKGKVNQKYSSLWSGNKCLTKFN